MLVNLRRAVIASLIFLAICGLAYPLAGVGVSQAFFHKQASGSLTTNGSSLIGQVWKGPAWFQGRPSATVNGSGKSSPYDAMSSGAANLGPRSKTLEQAVAKAAAALRKEGIKPTNSLVTSSGSGLDPDISPPSAYAQVPAVAAARGLPVSEVRALVTGQVHSAQFGFLGAPYVNVLSLNNALAKLRP